MAPALKIRPPFSWLGRHAALGGLIATVAIAAAFRFFQIDSLPPGLYEGSASLGLQAQNLVDHGRLPGLDAANGYAPLWVWLQGSSIKLFGHTDLALRLWPALLGILAVLTTWLWVRSWFGLRLAWLSAFLLAVTPWAVTLSRNGIEAAIFPLLTTLTLWTATLAWRRPNVRNGLVVSAALCLDLLAGPVGWLIALTTIVSGAVLLYRKKQLFKVTKARLVASGLLALGLAALAYLIGTSLTAVKALPQAAGVATSVSDFASNLVRTLLMFNLHGDENYRHNLSGEPMLNAFVGLMFIAGLLVAISRLHERRYRMLLLFFVVLLIPALVTTVGVPNAARVFADAPIILTLAAIGISYMLELWYRTFPINSAARATGQIAIMILLALTLFQGYTQYFKAWGGSSQVYAAYNEGAVQIANHIKTDGKDTKFTGQRFVVAPADEQPVVDYLTHRDVPYTAIQASGLAGLPITPGTRRFWIVSSSRDEAVKSLKLKFPGGTLRSHLSDFNQAEIYYTYEATK